VRWGIIGTGGMASTMVRAMQGLEWCDVAVVGSRTIESAEAFAADRGIGTAVGSHDDVAAHPDVDAVYVASTNDLHRHNALTSIAAGRAVLCEKPLAFNAAQAGEMIAAARDAGVLFMEAMWMRFQPSLARVDELVASGAIGRSTHLECVFGFAATEDEQRRWFSNAMGGGSLLDLGIYPLTLAHHLLGQPTHYVAQADSVHDIDRATAVSSLHAGGAVGLLSSTLAADPSNEATLSGTEGRLRLHAPFHHAHRVTLERDEDVVATHDFPHDGTGYEFELEHFRRCLSDGLTESPVQTHADSLAIMTWMDGIRRQTGIVYPGE
jgi:predicted dehydrogenase